MHRNTPEQINSPHGIHSRTTVPRVPRTADDAVPFHVQRQRPHRRTRHIAAGIAVGAASYIEPTFDPCTPCHVDGVHRRRDVEHAIGGAVRRARPERVHARPKVQRSPCIDVTAAGGRWVVLPCKDVKGVVEGGLLPSNAMTSSEERGRQQMQRAAGYCIER